MRLIDLTGKRFSRLLVIKRAATINKRTKWLCLCDCGNYTEVNSYNIKHKDSIRRIQSCGCLQKERATAASTKHGKIYSLEWGMYVGAKKRAKEKGIPFNIDIGDIIIPERCPMLNIPIFKIGGYQTENSPSLDRIDPMLGYVKGNIQVMSQKANAMKSTATFEEFETMYLNWKKKCH